MLKIYLLLLSLCVNFSYTLLAQNSQKIDSLQVLLQTETKPTLTRLQILSELGWQYRNSYFVKSLEYIDQAIALAQKLEKWEELAQAYNYKGVVYRNLGTNRQALENFFNALEIAKLHQIEIQIAYSYNNIGDIYQRQKEFTDKALINIKEAAKIFEKINNQRGLAYAYLRMGEVYEQIGQLDSALLVVKQSLLLREKIGKDNAYATSLKKMSEIYVKNKQLDEALELLPLSMEIFKAQNDVRGVVDVLIDYATIYQLKKDLANAQKYALEALEIASKFFFKSAKRDALKILYQTAQAQGNYRLAFEYQNRYITENDSLANQDIKDLVAKLDVISQLEKKQAQVALLEKDAQIQQEVLFRQRLMIAGVVILVILLMVVVLLLSLKNRVKQKANEQLTMQKQQIEEKSRELLKLYEEIKLQKEDLQNLSLELTDINRTKDKLFSITSHDMRSPLNTLKGLIALFNNGNISPEEMREMTQKLEVKVNTLSEFLDNLLNWSKAQMQGIEMYPEVINLPEIANEVIGLLAIQAQQKQITILNHLSEEIYCFADENLTALVLRNLISNAIKFTYNHGEINIKASLLEKTNRVKVQIIDNGIGLDEVQLKNIFSLESYTTRGTQQETGTGLGLILCREFVEKQGGSIEVESKKNEGSTFSFTLPLLKKNLTEHKHLLTAKE